VIYHGPRVSGPCIHRSFAHLVTAPKHFPVLYVLLLCGYPDTDYITDFVCWSVLPIIDKTRHRKTEMEQVFSEQQCQFSSQNLEGQGKDLVSFMQTSALALGQHIFQLLYVN